MQSPLILNEIESFLHEINQVTKYMLVGKSITQKRKKRDLLRDSDGNLIKPRGLDATLIKYYGYKKLEKSKALVALDVIKAYKKMEQIMLSNTDPTKLEDLALGPFYSTFCNSISSLTKLLLSTKLLPENARKANLEVLFSAIVIYRQFKVKAAPKFDTLLQEYDGSLKIESNPNFEVPNIERWLRETVSSEVLQSETQITYYSGNASSPNSGASVTKIKEDYYAAFSDDRL